MCGNCREAHEEQRQGTGFRHRALLHGLGVPRTAGRDLLVGRIDLVPAGVARDHVYHPVELLKGLSVRSRQLVVSRSILLN